eukprot:4354143-Heterocapsa_arctica.AAC.1
MAMTVEQRIGTIGSFLAQNRQERSNLRRSNQTEAGRGKEGYRRKAISWHSLYAIPEIRTGRKLQSQYSQGIISGRGEE